MKKILFVSLDAQGGGVTTVTRRLVPQLETLGYSIHYFSFRKLPHDVVLPCPVIYGSSGRNIFHRAFQWYRLWRYMRHYDIIIANMTNPSIINGLTFLNLFHKKKMILWLHCNLTAFFDGISRLNSSLSFLSRKKKELKQFINQSLVKYCYPRFDQVVCVSEGAREDLNQWVKLPPEKMHCIYNLTPIKDIQEKASSGTIPSSLEEKLIGHRVIMTVSRLADQKRIDVLLKAFQKIHYALPDTRLLIVGSGYQKRELINLTQTLGLESVVIFQEFLENPFPLMKQAHVFAHTSDFEGFAIVVLEALILGLPIVSTDCPSGPAEILDHGKFGTLIPVGDTDAAAKALIDQLEHPKILPSTDDFLKRFEAETIIPKWEAILKAVTE